MSMALKDLEKKLFDNGMGTWEIIDVQDYTITLLNKFEKIVDSEIKIIGVVLNLTTNHTNSFVMLTFSENSVEKIATIPIKDADESLLWPTSIWTRNIQQLAIKPSMVKALEAPLNETIKTINFFEP